MPVPFLHSLPSGTIVNLGFAHYYELNDLDFIYGELDELQRKTLNLMLENNSDLSVNQSGISRTIRTSSFK